MSKPLIQFYYDLETTGLVAGTHGIHQMSGLIEVDGEVVKEFNYKVKPREGSVLDPMALEVGGITKKDFEGYEPMADVYRKLVGLLTRYIDKYDRTNKAFLCGYNNATFDDIHLRQWFLDMGDPYFGSWFFGESLDVRILAAQYLLDRRATMPSFKLSAVAKELGISVDDTKLHDAWYDIYLTRKVYRIVTGLDMEI